MMKLGIYVLLTSVMVGLIASQCQVENCDNYDLLTQENSLGLMGQDEVDPLCRIINQLEMCTNKYSKDCPNDVRVMFEPAVRSAMVICQNIAAYKKALQCYFHLDVEEAIDICGEDLNEQEMNCRSISEYQNCITTDKSVTDICSVADINLLNDITTANLQTFLQMYNCIANTTETTLTSTNGTISSSTTSAPTRTTTNTNDPSGSGPKAGRIEGTASSIEKSLVLSVMTLFSVVLILFI